MSLLLQDKLVLSPETAKKLQQEIDDLAGATDCADVVGTKADLDSYDTSGLTDQAIIKVLQDESQNDAQTYYRYNKTSDSFTLIGELGPYYTKAESDVLLNAKQDTLVNQENIKSINGDSILGSGNLEISAHLVFPSTWPTTSSTTTKQFCDIVAADTTATQGKMYLGEVRWSDLSTVGLVNAEVVVEVMDGTTAQNKVIVLTMTSGNHAPYLWKYTYWNGGSNVSGWIGFQPELPSQSGNSGKVLTTNGSTLSWGEGLPSQTGNAGKFLRTDGTDASWSDKPVINNAINSSSIAIGLSSQAQLGSGVAVGASSLSGGGPYATAIGASAQAKNTFTTAIGYGAVSDAHCAIQLGRGSNYTRGTFAVGLSADAITWNNYRLLDPDGTIPADRLIHAINKYDTMPTAAAANLGWVVQYTGTTDSTYTHGYIYECVSDGLDPATYSWERIDLQPAPDMSSKVDKTNSASKVYGTDSNGAQTTYDVNSFGQVDDVQVNGTSIVSNKIASFVVDSSLDNSSANPVENQVVTSAISQKSGVVFRNWNA